MRRLSEEFHSGERAEKAQAEPRTRGGAAIFRIDRPHTSGAAVICIGRPRTTSCSRGTANQCKACQCRSDHASRSGQAIHACHCRSEHASHAGYAVHPDHADPSVSSATDSQSIHSKCSLSLLKACKKCKKCGHVKRIIF